MRAGIAIAMACAALAAAATPAGADPAPTPQAPVVVAGVPVTLKQAQERAGKDPSALDVDLQLISLLRARWIAGEAARRGVVARPGRALGILAREQRYRRGVDAWRTFLAQLGIPESERRLQIDEQALREALVDAITTHAGGDARRWGAALDDFNRRWRAVTVCAPGVGRVVRELCGSTTSRCTWFALSDAGFFGLSELCRIPKRWAVDLDLIEQLYPRAMPGDLACDPQGDNALARVLRRLRATAPRVARQVFFDADCDPQLVTAPTRSTVVTVLHAVATLAARARR